jgi:putative FmdB family regulatory protein
MPFYEFNCEQCNLSIDVYFNFTDNQEPKCTHCDTLMVKVIQATPAVFKGGGWGGQ